MISDKAKSMLADHIVSTFTKANVGAGGNTTNPTQLDLDVPLLTSKITATPTKSDENVIDFKITIAGSSADISGRSLREVGIFDSGSCSNSSYSTESTCTAAGATWTEALFTRLNFDALGPFSSSEEVEFFISVEVE